MSLKHVNYYISTLGGCPRMRNLLRKIHFGQLLRKLSLNRPIIRLKFAQNLPQTGFPSRRLSFSDSLLAIALLLLAASNTVSFAADNNGLERRLHRLENLLNNQVLIEQSQRLDQIQQELSSIRELVENQEHQLGLIKQRQRNLYQDIDSRLNDMETKAANAAFAPATRLPANGSDAFIKSSPVPPPGSSEPFAAAVPSSDGGNGKSVYAQAFTLLKEGRYKDAITAFKRFQDTHPDSSYGVNAQYWLGEAYSVTRDYKSALTAFQAVVNKYPKSAKVEGAMLKIGYTYYEMRDWKSAIISLEAVAKNYPDKIVARKATERLERIKREGH
ncbi:Cell division coordinator CpoB [hydrothermal vent metagenome]|uniref:Cell division coordinator CpoB n=2 Tax=hydrothermal vent metagenome TaxID=652676 RepID=A0A3B0X703_9ZZZZ